MKCDRCGNAMAYEQFFGDQERFWGWRCIFCGEIVAAGINKKDKSPKSPKT